MWGMWPADVLLSNAYVLGNMKPSRDLPAGRLCKKARSGAGAPGATVLRKSAPLKLTDTASTAAAICSTRSPGRRVIVHGHFAVRLSPAGQVEPAAGPVSTFGDCSATPFGKNIVCPTDSNLFCKQLPAIISLTLNCPLEPSEKPNNVSPSSMV